MSEADQNQWETWLSFVEYSYNTRRNKTTGFSPFELLYGVQPNEFMDYTGDTDQPDDVAIYVRSKQLKKLIESDRNASLETIKKAQEYQKKVQDKRTNPTEKAIGSKVMVVGSKVMVKIVWQ